MQLAETLTVQVHGPVKQDQGSSVPRCSASVFLGSSRVKESRVVYDIISFGTHASKRPLRFRPANTAPSAGMALPWGKQPSSAAVPGSGELDVSIVHWGERSARNANLFSPGKLPKDGAALC